MAAQRGHYSNKDFSDINPDYADEFNAFSLPVAFMPIGSAALTVSFRIPGAQTPAATRGFGVVFSDVERQGAASIKLFDAEGRSLGQYHAPVRSDPASRDDQSLAESLHRRRLVLTSFTLHISQR